MLTLPGCDIGGNAGGLDDQRVGLPAPDRIPEPARGLIGGTRPRVQIHGSPRVPFAVPQFEPVVPALTNLEIVRRKNLTGKSPRLAAKEPGILRRGERIV